MSTEWTPNTPGLIRMARAEIKPTRETKPLDQAKGGRTTAPDDLRSRIQPTVTFGNEESDQ